MDKEMQTRAAEAVRATAESKGLVKADLRRALGMVDRRTFDLRWDGTVSFTIAELATLADLMGARLADLLQPIDTDGDE